LILAAGLGLLLLTPGVVREAERVAEEAAQSAATDPGPALARARRALAMTAEFDPTTFVETGRKGEVVEDAFRLARRRYRRHRAILYAAVGECLAASGQHLAATRHFRRAAVLEPTGARAVRLARSLLAEGRAAEARWHLRRHADARQPTPELVAVLEKTADTLGLPSAQVELDSIRLGQFPAAQVEMRTGPLALPAAARLSTGGPFVIGDELVVLYVAASDCRSCSEDVQALAGTLPAGTALVMAPELPAQDEALRQVLRLYRHAWPVLLGHGGASALGLSPGTAVVVARRGWLLATVKPPLKPLLGEIVQALSVSDLREAVPRKAWNGRPPPAVAEPETSGLLAEGLAPGEDPPPSAPFTAGVDAFRARQYLEALRFFEAAEKKGDGYLLAPEARFNRALCLGRLGRTGEARRTMLAIADSRFQDEIDTALEGLGAGP
jgi:hypothetical protein